MEMLKFQVVNNSIRVTQCPHVITSGTVGLSAEFDFDSQWDELTKLVVFKAGSKTVTVELLDYNIVVPWEVLEVPNCLLSVGVYGTNKDGTIAIPTLLENIGVIRTGTNPEGDPAVDPTAPIWQEIRDEVEGLAVKLENTATQDALQELNDKIGGPTIAKYTQKTTKTVYWDIEYPTEDGKKYVVTVAGYTGHNLTRIVLYHCNSASDSTLIKGGAEIGESYVFDGNSAYKGVRVFAVISPEEDNVETLTATIGEHFGKSLFEKVEDIEDFVGMTNAAPNVLVLGDSYSAMAGGRWITQLKNLVEIGKVVNLGVSSATLKDKETDRTAYPYSDRPVASAGNGNNINTFGSQVEKLKRLMAGADLDDGESKVYENSAPDIILIEGGTNDLVDDAIDGYVSQIYTVEQGYIKSRFDSTVKSGSIKIPTPYKETDRTTFAGAMRYLYGVLHEMFPEALIFFITPCGLHYMSGSTNKYLEKGEQIKYAASLLCTPVIDWGVNGRLSMCDNVVTGTGTKEDPYIYDAVGQYSVDALHPNDAGAKLLAMEVAKVLTEYNLAKYTQ